MPMEWHYVSQLLPLTGLQFIPQVMHYEKAEPRWNDTDRE
jgi:hypothetical protein